ncbi:uncharacterized protein A4U43_C05F21980 [Asparagus officinalis]|uniref:Uncharacterized protein n=1 Tax=Asparagus officinalis TaxID=4686 RepID=A0A5P1EU70_ASPOF|nr:uncharacterized protein A4U43_C05F21980 [Asparagus officinalis]
MSTEAIQAIQALKIAKSSQSRKVMSTEAIQAIQALKIAKSSQSKDPSSSSFPSSRLGLKIAKSSQSKDPSSSSFPSSRLGKVFSYRIGRLIKGDLVAVLGELQRQNEWEFALQILFFLLKRFDFDLWVAVNLMISVNFDDMSFIGMRGGHNS